MSRKVTPADVTRALREMIFEDLDVEIAIQTLHVMCDDREVFEAGVQRFLAERNFLEEVSYGGVN